jgi:hypothetical protein
MNPATPCSPMLAHLASADLAEMARIFACAYLRLGRGGEAEPKQSNSRNQLAKSRGFEAPCVHAPNGAGAHDMKIEPNGDYACGTHASPSAREMTANERLDYMAEVGCAPRCALCERPGHAPYARRESSMPSVRTEP